MADSKIIQCPCVRCVVDTHHSVENTVDLQGETSQEIVWFQSYKTIQCQGCKSVSLRLEEWTSEDSPGEKAISYFPPRIRYRRPEWLEKLEQNERELFDLLGEVYDAVDRESYSLAATGIRTVLDRLFNQILGRDLGTFNRKLDQLVNVGELSETQRELFDIVIEGGSAAAHRGWPAPWSLLENMLSQMETLIHQTHISGPALRLAKRMIPPKPNVP